MCFELKLNLIDIRLTTYLHTYLPTYLHDSRVFTARAVGLQILNVMTVLLL